MHNEMASLDLISTKTSIEKLKNKKSVFFNPEGDHLFPISFHPVTGEKIPLTNIYDLSDKLNAVFFNPWNGERRDFIDVNNDLLGLKSIMLEQLTGFNLVVFKMREGRPAPEITQLFNDMNMSPDYTYGCSRISFLMMLIYHGYKELFFDFFNLSSNKDHRSVHGETIFHLSVREPEILRFLLGTGNYPDVDINYSSQFNNAIIIASSNIGDEHSIKNRMESIKMLVDAGGDINHKNIHGRTALMSAASSGNYDFIKFILSLGADKTILDNDGHDAKHYSCFSSSSFKLSGF